MLERGELLLIACFECWVVVQELLDDFHVFIGFETAGAVYDLAAWLQVSGSFLENARLLFGDVAYFVFGQPPANVQSTSHDAGVGTGSVHQNCVIQRFVSVRCGCRVLSQAGIFDSQAVDVVFEPAEPARIRVSCQDLPRLVHGGSHGAGFSSRSRTVIQNAHFRPGIELFHRQQGAGVLDIEQSPPETIQFFGGTGEMGDLEQVGSFSPWKRDGFAGYSLFLPHGFQLIQASFQGIPADVNIRNRVVPLEESGRVFISKCFVPFVDEPLGVGPGQVGLGRFPLVKVLQMPVFLPQEASKDGVDEPGLGMESKLTCRRNSFMDRRMIRDAVHECQLVESEPQHVSGAGFSRRLIGFFINPGIEQHQIAGHTEHHLLNQVAVNCFELGTSKGLAHDVFHKSGA